MLSGPLDAITDDVPSTITEFELSGDTRNVRLATLDDGEGIRAIYNREVLEGTATFDLRPAAIIRDLDLLRPIYAQTASYGHFGRELPGMNWERTDRVEALRAAI